MSRQWKDFRTNLMYWRFRHITRNRLRFRSWWARQRPTGRGPRFQRPPGMRERGLASGVVYRGSARRTWSAFAVLVLGLTALSALGAHAVIAPGLVPILSTVVVVGCIYWVLRGV